MSEPLVVALFAIAVIAVMIAGGGEAPREGLNTLGRLAYRLMHFGFSIGLAFAITSFFGAIALLIWNLYTYLRFGVWLSHGIGHILFYLGLIPIPLTGWSGVDKIVNSILELDAIPALMIAGPALGIVWMLVFLKLGAALVEATLPSPKL